MTSDTFELLLAWLGPDRDAAAQKYETIRAGLIRIFIARGCLEAEDLADETFNRVAAKAEVLQATFEGNPARYFYGVADKLRLEYSRRRQHAPLEDVPELRAPAPESDENAPAHECLNECLGELLPDQRAFILSYFSETKKDKVQMHQALAQRLGLSPAGMRTRVFRLKGVLQICINECLKNNSGA